MIALTVVLAGFVGIALGLLGGGGSTLTVPLLAFVAGLDARHAITTALLVVGVTSAVGSVAHARSGRVQWRAALLLGPTGMAGAYLGGRLALYVPGSISMGVFAVIMIVSATVLLNDRRNAEATTEPNLPAVKTAVLGISVGVVSGMTGAGGGFLLVAVLALVGGLALPIAVGTSLVIVTMHCVAALAGRLSGEHVNWQLAVMVTAAAVIGSLIGERMTPKIDPRILRTAFGVLILLMASVVIARETGPTFGPAAAGIAMAIVGLYLFARRFGADGRIDSLAAARPPEANLVSRE
ncbi:MAG: uncharacterized protein QOK33_5126 [Mycobacterium sp.]|nr:uncharacterized protein [Mycobacterium sp.]